MPNHIHHENDTKSENEVLESAKMKLVNGLQSIRDKIASNCHYAPSKSVLTKLRNELTGDTSEVGAPDES